MPRKIHLDRPTKSQRKRRGRYLEAQRARKSHGNTGKSRNTR